MFAYTYDDVTLVPNYSKIASRKDPNPSISLMNCELKSPIISANMDTITESAMAIALWDKGALGAMHRFMSVEQNCKEYAKVREADADCLVSLGVNSTEDGDWFLRAQKLHDVGARRFVIDVAHGHCLLVENAVKRLRDSFGGQIRIMAGNVATGEAVHDMALWGVDSVKVGVGAGSICTTRVVTGFGVPMFTSLLECSKEAKKSGVKLVADGGIRCSGDIVKAFVAGADAVMVGRLFAGTLETPGTSSEDGFKAYRGMSSASIRQRIGSDALPEGIDAQVPVGSSVTVKIDELTAGLKSGMSYAGATTLKELHEKTKWCAQTPHGTIEGTPHILR